MPVHAPEAVHVVAFWELQVSVERPPAVTEVGFALNEIVGAGGGGGLAFTVTVTD